MTVEHGLIGCPTNTGGLPVIVVQDPALQPPPDQSDRAITILTSLFGIAFSSSHMQFVASIAEQGVGYSLDSPVSGNNHPGVVIGHLLTVEFSCTDAPEDAKVSPSLTTERR